MTKQEMQNTIIRTWGFENIRTIRFFEICENYPKKTDKQLEKIFKFLMK